MKIEDQIETNQDDENKKKLNDFKHTELPTSVQVLLSIDSFQEIKIEIKKKMET